MDESKGLSYFFLGLGVGVAVGIVFAPKSGEETRSLIKAKVDEGKDFATRRAAELKDQASKTATDLKDQAARTATDLKDQASVYVDKGKEVVNRQKEQVVAAVEAGKQAYRETVGGPFEPASTGGTNKY